MRMEEIEARETGVEEGDEGRAVTGRSVAKE